MDDNDRNLRRYSRLMGLEGLPDGVRRSIALAWCFGMGRDHASAAEHLMRALEVLLEDWDERRDETTGATAEGSDRADAVRDGQADGNRAADAARGSGEAAADGERPDARVDCGGSL
jgi:hypothetical protein